MAVLEEHLEQISQRCARWTAQHFPDRAPDEPVVEPVVRGPIVTIGVVPEPLLDYISRHWGNWRPIAQLRHTDHGWQLYKPGYIPSWQLLDDIPAEASPEPLLAIIDDPDRAFW